MGVNQSINYEISNGMRLIGGLFIILHLCFLITIIIICQKFIILVDDVVQFKCTDPMTQEVFLYVVEGVRQANKKNIVSLIVVSIMGISELISTLILLFLARKVRK